MYDFTVVTMAQCESTRPDQVFHIGGYEQWGLFDERVWPVCTCKSYEYATEGRTNFGGKMAPNPCKHIREVYETVCGWTELVGPENFVEGDGDCPRCGEPVFFVGVAI